MKTINLELMIAEVESNQDYICCNCNEFVEDHWLVSNEDYAGQLLVVCPFIPINIENRFRPVMSVNFEELGRKLRVLYDSTGQQGHDIARLTTPHGVKIP